MSVEITPWFLAALGVWVVTSVGRSVFEALRHRHPAVREKKGLFTAMMVVMFLMWAAWGFMSFSDPVKMRFITWPRYIGAGIFIIGLGLFLFSEVAKKGVTDSGFLVTKGIYSKIRHPMYLGQSLMAVGLPLFTRGLVSLCLSILWVGQILFWKALEEKELLARYPEYADYKKRSWF